MQKEKNHEKMFTGTPKMTKKTYAASAYAPEDTPKLRKVLEFLNCLEILGLTTRPPSRGRSVGMDMDKHINILKKINLTDPRVH